MPTTTYIYIFILFFLYSLEFLFASEKLFFFCQLCNVIIFWSYWRSFGGRGIYYDMNMAVWGLDPSR